MEFDGKAAIITGGGQGIGEGIALYLAESGANIAIVDLNMETMPKEMQDKIANSYLFRRLAYPKDHANAVAFLASDKSNYIIGQTISVSSGYTMF